jgi:hypothetical protein
MGYKNYFPIVIDSEWDSENRYISLQCYVKKFNTIFFYYNKYYEEQFQSLGNLSVLKFPLSENMIIPVKFVAVPFSFEDTNDLDDSILMDLLTRFSLDDIENIFLEFFYSLRDLYPYLNTGSFYTHTTFD